jgi:hypothetical protein
LKNKLLSSFTTQPSQNQKEKKKKTCIQPLTLPKKGKKGLVPTHNFPQIEKMDLYPISNPPKK